MINAIGTTKLGGKRPDYHRRIEWCTRVRRAWARSYLPLTFRSKNTHLYLVRDTRSEFYTRGDTPLWHISPYFSLFLSASFFFFHFNIQEDRTRSLTFIEGNKYIELVLALYKWLEWKRDSLFLWDTLFSYWIPKESQRKNKRADLQKKKWWRAFSINQFIRVINKAFRFTFFRLRSKSRICVDRLDCIKSDFDTEINKIK